PSREYLLFDDQPESATPYTPSDVIPRTISSPMFTSVIWSGVYIFPMLTQLPNGITAIDVTAKITAIMGAAMYSGLFTCGGVRSSLKRNFTPSAAGCSSPNGPTRVGPHRFCICPTTLRSSQTVYATAVSSTNKISAILITETMMKVVIGNASSFLNQKHQPQRTLRLTKET